MSGKMVGAVPAGNYSQRSYLALCVCKHVCVCVCHACPSLSVSTLRKRHSLEAQGNSAMSSRLLVYIPHAYLCWLPNRSQQRWWCRVGPCWPVAGQRFNYCCCVAVAVRDSVRHLLACRSFQIFLCVAPVCVWRGKVGRPLVGKTNKWRWASVGWVGCASQKDRSGERRRETHDGRRWQRAGSRNKNIPAGGGIEPA